MIRLRNRYEPLKYGFMIKLRKNYFKGNKFYAFICSSCGQEFSFDEEDINREKLLPHIDCPTCKEKIQLPSQYRKYKEKRNQDFHSQN